MLYFFFRVKLVILYQLFSLRGGGRWGLRNWQNCTMGWFKRNGQDRRLGKNEIWHEGVVVVSLTNNSHREICDVYWSWEGPYHYIYIGWIYHVTSILYVYILLLWLINSKNIMREKEHTKPKNVLWHPPTSRNYDTYMYLP